jgi:TetR/AcrR family transcriptional repressor of bet genes
MPRPKKPAKGPIPRARRSHSRQHQLLIDACISALHLYGPSRTTVEKVVAIAKMSPGIVRFYFASKAAMLVASLQFLASEFEDKLMLPVARLKSNPVAALELLVDLYLDPELASPRKVSVWYAFWGEASSRQEYYDICGQKDESFAALCRDLIERLIIDSGQTQLDPEGVALGLIGVLEILWQEFAFKDEAEIDRVGAKRRCMAYLGSVFPGRFHAAGTASAGAAAVVSIPAWGYGDAHWFALERERVFQGSWQLAGHRALLDQPADFIAVELGIERALLVRDPHGQLRAFRNTCSEAPHSLVAPGAGRIERIECRVHGLEFGLDGKRLSARGSGNLTALDSAAVGDLVLVRSAQRGSAGEPPPKEWMDLSIALGSRPLHLGEWPIAADWKVVVEQWLDSAPPVEGDWSAGLYQRLVAGAHPAPRRRFIAPNHWVEVRADGVTVLQALPTAPGRSVLRQYHYTYCEAARVARAAQYLASRLAPLARHSAVAAGESTQQGLTALGATSATAGSPEVLAFRRYLAALLPATAYQRSATT